MKYQILFLLILVSTFLFAQNNQVENDSISENLKTPFVEEHLQQLNISFEVSNERTNYKVPFEGENFLVKSNLNIRYAFVFSYKFFSIRLGIRPQISDLEEQNKGKTKLFRLRVKLLFDKWSHNIEYLRNEGYYIGNSADINIEEVNQNFHIQFPSLVTNIIQGNSFYKFNDNYSVRAVESQTEIQLKSAGTFMPGIDYKYYNLKGADEVKISPSEIIFRDNYNELKGFIVGVNAGYYYTFVFHKYLFANLYANTGGNIDFYKSTNYESGNSNNNTNTAFVFSFKSGISAGYNGKKIFAGLGYDYSYSSEKFNENSTQIQPSKDQFNVYLGYRFKAPKQLRKPVEKIEEIVPILKKDKKIN
ncbi:MAG: DUF4421 domain-containing protein [Flavobacteriaceae bacterium]|nr:DUF4421 domain-containing protein [Flavobacteriaceae bacterium]